jgi:threonine/homoserine/homoserine lactone efflux protein
MSFFAIGIALGLVVSIPPGPNTALCINLACRGVRRAAPLITGAALTDAAYSLLAASGILIVSQASSQVLAYLAPCLLLGTAVLAWSPESLSGKVSAGVAFFNPATAAILLGLAALISLVALIA